MADVGRFSCAACGRSFSWKPELAGKRVKCKCGEKLTVPATDPAAEMEPAPDGFDDLMALAEGAPASDNGYAPAAVAAPVGGGSACPSCGSRVDAAAVICVNCGHNLKTGKKLKTSKLAGDAVGGAASQRVPGYRSFGVKDVAGESMSPEKKKMLAIALTVVLVLMVGGIIVVIIKGLENDRQHQAKLAANPPKLEKMIDNMDKAGGIGAAMHDGSLLNGVSNPQRASAEMQIERQRAYYKLEERGAELMKANNPLARTWLTGDPKAHFYDYDNAASIKIVDQLAALGATEIRTDYPPAQNLLGVSVAGGVIARLPKDPAARKKIFAWYDALPHVIEGDDQPHPEEMGQTYIAVEFKPEKI
jgi:DNA-directed RNA polymerase subunit RPC12/RpoP